MSFRHTYITEFLYKHGLEEELKNIKKTLGRFGTVNWNGRDGLGYFHGVIKDLDSYETKENEKEIVHELEKLEVQIKIVFES